MVYHEKLRLYCYGFDKEWNVRGDDANHRTKPNKNKQVKWAAPK